MLSPRALALACLLAVLLSAGEARATPRISVARGSGASSCPEADELKKKIEAILERPAFSSELGELGFDVEISAHDEGFSATIRVAGSRQGQRSLRDPGPGCAGLGDALALSIAMMLDGRSPKQASAPVPLSPTSPASPEPLAQPAVVEQSHRTLWLAWAGGGLGAGVLASPGLLLSGGLGLSRGAATAALSALWMPEQHLDLGPGSFSVGLAGLGGRGCWRLAELASIDGCALLNGGFFRASGVDYPINRTSKPIWIAGGLGVQASGALAGPVGWELRLDGLAALREQTFWVESVGTTPTPPLPRLGLALSVGVRAQIR